MTWSSLLVLVALAGAVAGCGHDREHGTEAGAIRVCREAVAERLDEDAKGDDVRGPGIPVQHLLSYDRPHGWAAQGLDAPQGWIFRGLTAPVDGGRTVNFECRVVRDDQEELGLDVDDLLVCGPSANHPWGCTDPARRFTRP